MATRIVNVRLLPAEIEVLAELVVAGKVTSMSALIIRGIHRELEALGVSGFSMLAIRAGRATMRNRKTCMRLQAAGSLRQKRGTAEQFDCGDPPSAGGSPQSSST